MAAKRAPRVKPPDPTEQANFRCQYCLEKQTGPKYDLKAVAEKHYLICRAKDRIA
jgi:molybdenum cofactor biosynthesis enzyme MoaA